MIVSVQNQKGGVGKTATAVSLAAVARDRARRVLLVDLDPQASTTRWLDLDTGAGLSDLLDGAALSDALTEARPAESDRPPLHVLAADEALLGSERALGDAGDVHRLREVLTPARDSYDLIVIDGGPAITTLSANALYAADLIVAPLALSSMALDGIARLRELVALADEQGHALRALYLPTAADARLRETRELLGVLHDAFGDFPDGDVLPPIRYSSAISRAFGMRQTITEYAAAQREESGRDDPAAARAVEDYGALLDHLDAVR